MSGMASLLVLASLSWVALSDQRRLLHTSSVLRADAGAGVPQTSALRSSGSVLQTSEGTALLVLAAASSHTPKRRFRKNVALVGIAMHDPTIKSRCVFNLMFIKSDKRNERNQERLRVSWHSGSESAGGSVNVLPARSGAMSSRKNRAQFIGIPISGF